jgi:hypothetical protein
MFIYFCYYVFIDKGNDDILFFFLSFYLDLNFNWFHCTRRRTNL